MRKRGALASTSQVAVLKSSGLYGFRWRGNSRLPSIHFYVSGMNSIPQGAVLLDMGIFFFKLTTLIQLVPERVVVERKLQNLEWGLNLSQAATDAYVLK